MQHSSYNFLKYQTALSHITIILNGLSIKMVCFLKLGTHQVVNAGTIIFIIFWEAVHQFEFLS